MEVAEPETEADADAVGSCLAASQVQDSFPESDADTDTTSKAAIDPFKDNAKKNASQTPYAKAQAVLLELGCHGGLVVM